ncbi:Large exoprotein involved in heme utilization or adhesion [Rhodopirellula islandica]|uniref:Large exoprotein involved in heme utilization or adhesion n=1 Tax=Rhodopirellula islandica TaxID=595434 RepID=A0A0J1EHH3_RHOIS|nr:filamentous hemagglutinin N-terminal domain-containing protein [Rhodopirellula islandica]KLU04959.1 Large exoprotein involved in heme utilization or adhesion [Rhodopirellula islandica]
MIRRRRRRHLKRLQILALLGWATSSTGIAIAQNPTGGNVVAGAATINSVGNTLNVNASTDRAVVNWNSFSVGQGNTANFNLPSASSAILNRVTTPGIPSVIAGQLNSNGNVFLVNPSGVVVGNTGVINTNGFTASTFDTTNRQFMDGGPMSFRGSSTASIVNNGTINTGAGGAHFIGNQFNNNGTITSAGGSITVGSGQTVTYANGVTHVEADMATLQNGYSETAGLIKNSGTLRATGAVMSGGDVYLTNPGGRVINSGLIGGHNVAVNTGQFNTIGTIDASGDVGGDVIVQSSDALIQGTIDASGTTSGGSVQIDSGVVDQYATIDASATSGVGGSVTITTESGYTATTAGNINVAGASGGEVTIDGPGRIVSSATISAVGTSGDGGNIDVASDFKTSLLGATLDASGQTDGGQIRVGGEFQGGKDLVVDELANSSETLVSPGTQLIARGENGEGGTAIVWSNDRTQFHGGVDVAGNSAGGFVELSSAGNLVYQTTDEIQTGGGSVLLDPKNGVIVDSAPSGLNLIEFSLSNDAQLIDSFDRLGSSIDFINSGSLLAVGATGDAGGNVAKESSGAVYLFELDTNSLRIPPVLQQIIRDGSSVGGGTILTLDAGDKFGSGVALDGNGNVLAVGASGVDAFNASPLMITDNSGAVFLFQLDADNPSSTPTLRQVIQDDSPLAGGGILDLVESNNPNLLDEIIFTDFDDALRLGRDAFGSSVDLNDAGDRLVVGAPSSLAPLVYLFDIDPSDLASPADLAQTLNDPVAANSFEGAPSFGSGVSLNGIGNRLAVGVGGAGDTSNDGRVLLYNLGSTSLASPAVLAQTIETGITLADGSSLDVGEDFGSNFGSGVDFNQSGTLLAVGDSSTFSPSAFIFELDATNLAAAPGLQQVLESGTVLGDGDTLQFGFNDFGSDVALTGDGGWLAVGSPNFDGPLGNRDSSGSVFLFDLNEDPAGPILSNLIAADGQVKTLPGFMEAFGRSVAMNSDGSRLVVGNVGEYSQEVFLFEIDDAVAAPTLVGVIEDRIVVATPAGDEMLMLDAEDRFGSSLALNDAGDLLAVGARGDDGVSNADSNSGAIYLFDLTNAELSRIPSLSKVLRNEVSLAGGTELTLGDNSGFGQSVALTGDGMRLAAGASAEEMVFLFEFGGANFTGMTTLASTLQHGSPLAEGGTLNLASSVFGLGNSVALNSVGDRLAVGEINNSGGAVRLFELNPNDWGAAPSQPQQLRRDSILEDGSLLVLENFSDFGAATAMDDSGTRLAVGQTDNGSENRVFLFELDDLDLSSPAGLKQIIGNGTSLTNGDDLTVGFSEFGATVALNGTGDRLVVGDPDESRINVFSFDSGLGGPVELSQTIGEGSTLSYEDFALSAEDGFGQALAFNGAGDLIAIEAQDRVHLFEVDSSLSTTPLLASVIRDGTDLSDGRILELNRRGFGSGLALNSAGDILAIGHDDFNFGDGAVFLFGIDPNELSNAPNLENTLTRGVNSSSGFVGIEGFDFQSRDSFGQSVSLNAAGDVLVVGAQGKVHLISLDVNRLDENPTRLQTIEDGSPLAGGGTLSLDLNIPEDFSNDAKSSFGTAVAINRASNRLAVGDPAAGDSESQSGSVFIFGLNPSDLSASPTLAQEIQDGSSLGGSETLSLLDFDRFGESVGFNADGSSLAVGAPSLTGDRDDLPNTGGRVFLFDLNPANINASPTINTIIGNGTAIAGGFIAVQSGDALGSSVALTSDGNLLAIGSPGASFGENAKPGIGKVSLISFGGPSIAGLSGDLAFADFPAETTFIDPDDIAAILNAGNDLTLQFSNDLEIRSDIMTAATGVGKLTVQTGRSINVLPGTDINIGDGSLTLEFNSQSALSSQTDPGSPLLRLNGVSIVATGDDSLVELFGDELEESESFEKDPLIHITGSFISSSGIEVSRPSAFFEGHRILIDGDSVLSGDRVTVRGTGNTVGLGVEILGAGTQLIATEELQFGGFGGNRIADGATLRGVGEGIIGLGGFQFPSDPFFDDFIAVGDSLVVENASVRTENGQIGFEGISAEDLFDDGGIDPVRSIRERNSVTLINSELVAGGSGSILMGQAGSDAYQFTLSESTISGQNVLIALNLFNFDTDSGTSTFRLTNQSQINTAVDGELRIALPFQSGVAVDASSSLNGVSGNDLFDTDGNLINSLGIAGSDGNPLSFEYLGTPQANFAFYLASIDLTPGLFFTANDGSSTYGQTPVDPGLSITRGVLQQGDTLQTIGVETDFNLTQLSDAGEYTINVMASDLDPKYRLLGTASGTFTILPADLLIRTEAATKTYGDTFSFADHPVVIGGLRNGDLVGSLALSSDGAAANASVSGSPYVINAVAGAGENFNPSNYVIKVASGGLTVNPASLSINPLAQSKVYGDSALDQSLFNAVGLKNGETIRRVSFASPGIAATADVGNYDLRAEMVTGSGNGFDPGNYVLQFGSLDDGLLVTPASLQIRPFDQSKLVGDTFVFAGNEFLATGLKNDDTIASASLMSEGTSGDAPLGASPILLSNPIGNFDADNYILQILTGDFIVREEAVVPDRLLLTEQLVYDQFGRYRDFAETIDALIPGNVGTIDFSGAFPDRERSGSGTPSDDSPNDLSDQASGENDVYLPITIRPR